MEYAKKLTLLTVESIHSLALTVKFKRLHFCVFTDETLFRCGHLKEKVHQY